MELQFGCNQGQDQDRRSVREELLERAGRGDPDGANHLVEKAAFHIR